MFVRRNHFRLFMVFQLCQSSSLFCNDLVNLKRRKKPSARSYTHTHMQTITKGQYNKITQNERIPVRQWLIFRVSHRWPTQRSDTLWSTDAGGHAIMCMCVRMRVFVCICQAASASVRVFVQRNGRQTRLYFRLMRLHISKPKISYKPIAMHPYFPLFFHKDYSRYRALLRPNNLIFSLFWFNFVYDVFTYISRMRNLSRPTLEKSRYAAQLYTHTHSHTKTGTGAHTLAQHVTGNSLLSILLLFYQYFLSSIAYRSC